MARTSPTGNGTFLKSQRGISASRRRYVRLALMSHLDDPERRSLLRRGFALEYATLAWNVVGIVVLAVAAIHAKSVALAGFGLDSLIEVGASLVVIWELSGVGAARQRFALRLIAPASGR
jgi:hypothetical protein